MKTLERRYRELFENIPDGVYESSPDGRILAANPALVRMLGFSSEDELRREGAAGMYLDPADRDRNKAEMARSGHLRNAEFLLRRQDGAIITVLENARAVLDEAGAVLYYQGTLTDITDRKIAEHDLCSARDQALEASRLKSQFLANISHELRTPLNAVLGMAQILQDSALPPTAHECAQTIRRSAQVLLDLITEILDYSKIEAGRLELDNHPFSVREVVSTPAEMLQERASAKGLQLLATVDPAVPDQLFGDPTRLRQVLTNLLANAVKFTEHGAVHLLVRLRARDAGRARVVFEVRDTGIGIPPEARDVIFEPFRQADGSTTRRYGGTGLGLAIVREILERMGSRVELESTVGAGSIFRFTLLLPIAGAAVSARPDPAAALHPLARRLTPHAASVRLLIAEDNTVNQRVILRMAEKLGYHADLVPNGLEALRSLEREHFDLVLMDCQMPEMDGFRATAAIRSSGAAYARIPIVALTAHAADGNREACLAAGMDDYLPKPIFFDELSRKLEHWLRRCQA
jgi:PAS domain S-box-containing protein